MASQLQYNSPWTIALRLTTLTFFVTYFCSAGSGIPCAFFASNLACCSPASLAAWLKKSVLAIIGCVSQLSDPLQKDDTALTAYRYLCSSPRYPRYANQYLASDAWALAHMQLPILQFKVMAQLDPFGTSPTLNPLHGVDSQ